MTDLRPRVTQPSAQWNPSPARWLDLSTLRLDDAGRRVAAQRVQAELQLIAKEHARYGR